MQNMNRSILGSTSTPRLRISPSSISRVTILVALLLVGLVQGPVAIIRFLAAPITQHGHISGDAVEMAADIILCVALFVFCAGYVRETMVRYRGLPIASILAPVLSRHQNNDESTTVNRYNDGELEKEPTDEELMAAAADDSQVNIHAPEGTPKINRTPMRQRFIGVLRNVTTTLTASRRRRDEPAAPLRLPSPSVTEDAHKDDEI
jgi:hypothetical protein